MTVRNSMGEGPFTQGARAPRPSAFAQYRALLAKDVRQELRTREMLTSMAVYSLLVLTVYGAALAQVGDKLQIVSFAGGLLWALIVLDVYKRQRQAIRGCRARCNRRCRRPAH